MFPDLPAQAITPTVQVAPVTAPARPTPAAPTPATVGDRMSLSPTGTARPARAVGREILVDDRPFHFQGLNVYDLADVGRRDPAELRRTLQTIAATGANVVRFWAYSNVSPEDVRRVLDTSNEMGLHLRFVPVLGNHWSYSPEGGNKTPEWYRDGYRTEYRPAAERMVTALKDRPEILMWELMNEPESTDHQALYGFVSDMSAMIKSHTSNLVSIGTLTDRQAGLSDGGFQHLHEIPTVDVVTWHDYALDQGATPEAQASHLEAANRSVDNVLAVGRLLNKPVFVGEVGVRVTQPHRGAPIRDVAVAMHLTEQRVERAMAGGAVGALSWGPEPNGHGMDGDGFGFPFTADSAATAAIQHRMTRSYPDSPPAPAPAPANAPGPGQHQHFPWHLFHRHHR